MSAMTGIKVFERAREDTKRVLAASGTLQRLDKGRVIFRDKDTVKQVGGIQIYITTVIIGFVLYNFLKLLGNAPK